MNWDGYVYNSVNEVKSHQLDVPMSSFISAICAHCIDTSREHEFVVAFNKSTVVHRYNSKSELLSTVDGGGLIHSITLISCVNDLLAIVDPSRSDVILLKEDTRGVHQFGLISAPGGVDGFLPRNILWDGGAWLVLWVFENINNKSENSWHLAYYKESGENLKTYKRKPGSDRDPITIGRCNDDFIVVLMNRQYEFGNYDDI